MSAFNFIKRFTIRFRYPFSLPEDVAKDIGLEINNLMSFDEFIKNLTNPVLKPKKLNKFMPRNQAEELFKTALRKEKFSQKSLISYHFNGGWMEFVLQFDDESLLRRIYIQHKDLKNKYEIPIS